MSLTPEAKKLLGETIRGTQQSPEKGLRAQLLRAIHDEADRRYRLSVRLADAKLDEAHRKRRERIEAWIDERARAAKASDKAELKAVKDRLLGEAEKEAAATFLNRLVLLRLLEAQGLSKPFVLTGGWSSRGYREFRDFAPTLCTNGTTDATEGYATLLRLLFDELAIDLPGLYGDVGLTRLFPIPAATLREVVERLDDPLLASAWADETTLGWVYQYWNDPDREALDAKINGGGKIEPHEIASKTQMFTERYIVEWLLQNSLGLTWLAMCKKCGWTADAERALPVLDARRADWRAKRDASEVALDALMPIEGELEEHWKYYVLQPIPDDAVAKAPESVRAIKILDPACGSGHFLVIAFGLLTALYREEARHLGTTVSDREIAESILENNLHGIDIDPRAIQIAAAGLYLRAKSLAKDARPKTVNLVAPVLQLGALPDGDPAVVRLREELKREAGLPEELTNKVLKSLAGVDYLGSLLKVDATVDDAIRSIELAFERTQGQGDLFQGFRTQQMQLSPGEVKVTLLHKLETFLAMHSRSEDLGLRLDGEELAAGVRFLRMTKDKAYHIVLGNPPYQSLSKTQDFGYIAKTYVAGRTDLYAAFWERGLTFVRPGGLCALLTMRNWLFIKQYTALRQTLFSTCDVRALGDFAVGAFEDVPNDVLSVVVVVLRASSPSGLDSVAQMPTPLEDRSYDRARTFRKRAAVLGGEGVYYFRVESFKGIDLWPLPYWWSEDFTRSYNEAPKLGACAPAESGIVTGDDVRFTRFVWEVQARNSSSDRWSFLTMGAKGLAWFEPARFALKFHHKGLELRAFREVSPSPRFGNPDHYYCRGVAFSMISDEFDARVSRMPGLIGKKGCSVFPSEGLADVLCLMNSSNAKFIMRSLNPGMGFEVHDVNRLPLLRVSGADAIFARLESAFAEHEAAREPSVEFLRPGPSAWAYAQAWAQRAVDRSHDAPLTPYAPSYDQPTPKSYISFALGVALGHFGSKGEGVLDIAPRTTLANGLLFISPEKGDSLDTPACQILHDAWEEHGAAVAKGNDLANYLRKSFFEFHKKCYESRPVYFPLSSANRAFVAFASIHRWADDTLNVLLADHLVPTRRRLEGEIEDLRAARTSGSNKAKAEKRFDEVQNLLEELNDFISKVTDIAEKGPPSVDDKTEKREVDARYVMDLDDGVMVNSAALWPLLEPQWKDPKKWWKELANAQGKKDYDWSHLAARYFPTRVRKKCHVDPSLAVAHKCFWELHPAKAYAWELRLQDEIRPDFTIDEPGSNEARARFLREHEREASEILAKELKRRERKSAKADDENDAGPLFDQDDDDAEEQADA